MPLIPETGRRQGTMAEQKRVLVTGSTGFIGGHLVRALLRRGHKVYCLLRGASRRQALEGLGIIPVRADYALPETLRAAVKGMDWVFHLGAVIKADDWETYYQVNTLGTRNLVEACSAEGSGKLRLVYVSSIAASGPSSPGILKQENDPCEPINFYGESKRRAEEACREYADHFPVVIVRPPNVMGYGQKDLLRVMRLINRRIQPRLGSRERRTSICFVEDLVEALILAAESDRAPGETYFVTNDEECSWFEMVDSIAQNLNRTRCMIHIPYRALIFSAGLSKAAAWLTRTSPLISRDWIENPRLYDFLYSSAKIQLELGFRPRVKWESGLKEIIERYRKDGLL